MQLVSIFIAFMRWDLEEGISDTKLIHHFVRTRTLQFFLSFKMVHMDLLDKTKTNLKTSKLKRLRKKEPNVTK
jgi:hypothetical protein